MASLPFSFDEARCCLGKRLNQNKLDVAGYLPIKKVKSQFAQPTSPTARKIGFEVTLVCQKTSKDTNGIIRAKMKAESGKYLDLWSALDDQVNIIEISKLMDSPDEFYFQIVEEKKF